MATSTYVKADDQSALSKDGVELTARLDRDRAHALVSLGTATEFFVLELARVEVVKLAQTLLAMAGVMPVGAPENEAGYTLDVCEWNPRKSRPASSDDEHHGWAVWSVGANGKWHLCEACAALPEFNRHKRRVWIGPAKAKADATMEGG